MSSFFGIYLPMSESKPNTAWLSLCLTDYRLVIGGANLTDNRSVITRAHCSTDYRLVNTRAKCVTTYW